MTEHIKKLYDFFVVNKEHHQFRKHVDIDLSNAKNDASLTEEERVLACHEIVLNAEDVLVFEFEKIAGTRLIKKIPDYEHESYGFLNGRASHMLNEPTIGGISNNVAEYGRVIAVGTNGIRDDIHAIMDKTSLNRQETSFLKNQLRLLDVIDSFADKFKKAAKSVNNDYVYNTFCNIPQNGAKTFLESLQFLRFLNFVLRYENPTHSPLGRFDQYMYPFYKKDIESGMSKDEAFDLISEFFLSLNRDTDIYFGIQQGDNGQAIVLGGCDENGENAYNDLSELCLKVSLDLAVIDPKINLRVDKKTPLEIFELCTKLTRKGLGFPQYSNDDIVIPALVEWGYEIEDARDYAVAGCWEFIIPGYGAEGINYEAMPFVKIINKCVLNNLENSDSFEDFMLCVKNEINNEMMQIHEVFKGVLPRCSPMSSLLSKQAIQKCEDISTCSKYKNIGVHGPGISTAIDSLAAIKKYVFDDNLVTATEMTNAVATNFENNAELLHTLRYESPKMGNNNDFADNIAIELTDMYADVLSKYKNDFGGCYRPGTGSAMYYIWNALDYETTPDGRLKGEPLAANFSPSLLVKSNGPLSMFKSFCKLNLKRICNGGPVTLELHSSVFTNEETINKVAILVKMFIDLGGHQLQLNSVDTQVLIKAQENPEQYKNLIVRVWGWSGYFVELSKSFQDHIIERETFKV